LAAVARSALLSKLIWTITIGSSVVAAIAFFFLVTVLVSLVVALLIERLTLAGSLVEPLRRRLVAQGYQDGGGGPPPWRLGLGDGVVAA
jgi:hypothetical protein